MSPSSWEASCRRGVSPEPRQFPLGSSPPRHSVHRTCPRQTTLHRFPTRFFRVLSRRPGPSASPWPPRPPPLGAPSPTSVRPSPPHTHPFALRCYEFLDRKAGRGDRVVFSLLHAPALNGSFNRWRDEAALDVTQQRNDVKDRTVAIESPFFSVRQCGVS